MPEIFLAGLVIAFLYVIWYFVSGHGTTIQKNLRNPGILLLASIFPIAYVIVRKSVLYNAERHLMFVIPPLACLAVWGCYLAVSKLSKAWKSLITVSALVYLIFHVTTMTRLHPDEYVYFNQLVGGLKGAYGRYDTDYWGNSYREAVLDLSDYLRIAKASDRNRRYKIYLKYIDRACVTYYFPSNFLLTYNPKRGGLLYRKHQHRNRQARGRKSGVESRTIGSATGRCQRSPARRQGSPIGSRFKILAGQHGSNTAELISTRL